MTALIIAAGDVTPHPLLLATSRRAELVIAADGGLRHARTLGVTPGILVGDLDSVTRADLGEWPDVPRIVHPADKDQTDLELAVELAVSRGADELVLCGTFGSRPDQSLAALLLAARLQMDGLTVELDSGVDHGWALTAGPGRHLDLLPDEVFSVLSLTPSITVTVSGARYRPEAAVLEFGSGLGVSNVALGPVEITVHDGVAAVLGQRP